jgi:hypothetical protein
MPMPMPKRRVGRWLHARRLRLARNACRAPGVARVREVDQDGSSVMIEGVIAASMQPQLEVTVTVAAKLADLTEGP